MKHSIYIILAAITILFSSCRSDFSTVPSTGELQFSKTKIFLDTIFNNIGSSTYGLKVYNRSNKDINIPKIQLGKGLASKYRMMIDGMTGNQNRIFDNVEILANDSLFVFIEITNNISTAVPTEFTYDDQILFDVGTNQQKVDLTTLIWDAKFIFPNRPISTGIRELLDINGNATDIIGHRLTDNDFSPIGSWTINNLKPTVIYGYALVPNGKTLTIEKGASLYFHADGYSGIIVENGGQLIVDGKKNEVDTTTGALILKNEVTFEADRLEPFFEDVPGQWGGVFIISDATTTVSNKIKNLKLKNSTFGVYTQNINGAGATPNLEIIDTQIYNSSVFGLLNRKTNVLGKNVVINLSGQANLACLDGGTYDFTHCTFNNNWQSTKQVSVLISDYEVINKVANSRVVNASFKNCIVYGSNSVQLKLDYLFSATAPEFRNCMFKFNDANTSIAGKALYNFINIATPPNGNLKGYDPKFKNAAKNQLNILAGSPAIGAANFSFSNFNDILDNVRTNPSDIGAYNKP